MNELQNLQIALAMVGVQIDIKSLDLFLNTLTESNNKGGSFTVDDATKLIQDNNEKYPVK